MSVLKSLFCPLCRNLITSLFVFTCSKTFVEVFVRVFLEVALAFSDNGNVVVIKNI